MSYTFIHPKLMPEIDNFDNQSSDFYMYQIKHGVFRHIGHSKTWRTCREQFHGETNSIDGMYLACNSPPDYIARFIMRTEMLLNLSPLLLSKVHQCETKGRNQGYLLQIQMSPFWKKYRLREYFFTVVLRASLTLKNIDDPILPCIMECSYALSTPRATAKFLAGYNCHSIYSGSSGWVLTFSEPSQANEILTRPTEKTDLDMLHRPGIFSNLTEDDKDKLKKWVQHREKKIAGTKFELNLD